MARKYYTLLERLPGELWTQQFGDYDRSVVAQEGDDRKDSGDFTKGTKMKIIATADKQAAIDAEVLRINLSLTKEARRMRRWSLDAKEQDLPEYTEPAKYGNT